MSYIVLRDTLGNGLEVPDFSGQPDVIEKGCLDVEISGLVAELIEEDRLGNDLAYKSVVICEILDKIDGKDIADYVKEIYEECESKSKGERYDLYLQLKAEFEP